MTMKLRGPKNLVAEQLPPEVWDHIFSYMSSTRDLKNLSLVCTRFYVVVTPILWKAPTLRTFNIEDFYQLHTLPM